MGKKGAAKRRRPPMDVDQAALDYERGTSLRALSEATGYCYGTVRNKLLDAGVVLRRPGGNRRRRSATSGG